MLSKLKKFTVKRNNEGKDDEFVISYIKDDVKSSNTTGTKTLPKPVFDAYKALSSLITDNIGSGFTSITATYVPKIENILFGDLDYTLAQDNNYPIDLPTDGLKICIELKGFDKASYMSETYHTYLTQAYNKDLHLFASQSCPNVSGEVRDAIQKTFFTLNRELAAKSDSDLHISLQNEKFKEFFEYFETHYKGSPSDLAVGMSKVKFLTDLHWAVIALDEALCNDLGWLVSANDAQVISVNENQLEVL